MLASEEADIARRTAVSTEASEKILSVHPVLETSQVTHTHTHTCAVRERVAIVGGGNTLKMSRGHHHACWRTVSGRVFSSRSFSFPTSQAHALLRVKNGTPMLELT